jgi:hypothetical protein
MDDAAERNYDTFLEYQTESDEAIARQQDEVPGDRYRCPTCRRIVGREEIIVGTHTDPVTHTTEGVGCVYCQKPLTPEESKQLNQAISQALSKVLP